MSDFDEAPACRREGHGPVMLLPRRTWWAPWRTGAYRACWVCRAPLTMAEGMQARRDWPGTAAFLNRMLGWK